MSKKTGTLTDFHKQLIAGMEEVVAHINGEPNKGRATVVEFADAKAIREGLRMSQAVFSRAYGIPLKTCRTEFIPFRFRRSQFLLERNARKRTATE